MGRLSSRDRPEQLTLYAAGEGVVLTDDFSAPNLADWVSAPSGPLRHEYFMPAEGQSGRGEPPTLAQFIGRLGIRMTAHRVERNPNMEDDDWAKKASHWRCILTRPRLGFEGRASAHRMSSYFSRGDGLGDGGPGVEEMLNSLMSDAQTVESEPGFDGWSANFGGESEVADRRTFLAVLEGSRILKAFLGFENYRELVEDVTVL